MKVDPDPLVPDTYVRSSKQVLIYQTKWGPKARKWPRAGVYGKSAGSVWRRVEFGYIAAQTKNAHALDYETAVQLSRGTEYVPRDLIMLAMTGKLYQINDSTGLIWNSWRMTVPNVQDVLEQLTNQPGTIIVRGQTFWEFIDPGNEQDVLTFLSGMPIWAPNSGGGGGGGATAYGWRTPIAPDVSLFSLETDAASNVVVTPYDQFGFTMQQPAVNATQHAPYGCAAPTGAAWTLIVGLRLAAKPNLQFLNGGIYLRHSGSARMVTWGFSLRAGIAPFSVAHWNGPTSFNSEPYNQPTQGDVSPSQIWLKVENDGTNFIYSMSVDGLTWVFCFQESKTAWLSSPCDRIGLTVDAENSDTSATVALTCFDFLAV